MSSIDRWIQTDKRNNKLVIRFSVKGFDKQFFISSGLIDTPQNRALVQLRRDLIETDIKLERFDPSLNSYQFNPTRRAEYAPYLIPKGGGDLLQLWDKFTDFKKALLEPTTIKTNYSGLRRYILRLPTTNLNHASKIRDWLLDNTTPGQAWRILKAFSECCTWAVNSRIIDCDPFAALQIKKPRRKSTEGEHEAFTLYERDCIIKAFELHPKHSYHANLIKFLFFTGARLGEAFALTWGDVQRNCTRISINKSCNRYNYLKGTKNGKRRIFPTVEGSKLQTMLLEMRRSAGEIPPNTLVFKTATGRRYTSAHLQHIWNGSSVKRNGESCKTLGVVSELAARGVVPYLRPYSTRHTFATWAISQGISPDKVALWIGDEVQTVLKFYCHPAIVTAECPDF